jgi:hypothetical protein
MNVSLLEVVAAILLSAASVLVLWAIRLCDSEPEKPVAPASPGRVEPAVPLRRAA